jgi:DNA-directed RNA polymerase subunit RPC12/RpoP
MGRRPSGFSRPPAGIVRYRRPMCFYAETPYKLHYVCLPCRVSFKKHPEFEGAHACPRCSRPLLCAGHDFAAPRRHDVKGWSVVAAVLNAGLRYEGRESCGCVRDPKFRPRTRAQLRARRIIAARTGTPLAEGIGRRDPLSPH